MLSDHEETLLIADLLEAASSVANTAGTFGCFLASWSSTSLRPVQVAARPLRAKGVEFSATEADVFSVASGPDDTVYLDPPYTKRQYAAYYHVLETLAYGDEPVVSGVTGLRPWRMKNSPFCHKQRALPAMIRLVQNLQASRVLISYSADGHIDLEALAGELQMIGDVRVHTLGEIARYQPNCTGPTSVREFVLELTRMGG
jgi:adenine-specific DNA-methyltransferase